MKTIVGLGNPGESYQQSKHNIGFMLLDYYALYRKMMFKKDGNALLAKRNQFLLIKPTTYMNLSGKAVVRYVDNIEDSLIICDDIYLPLGEIRLRSSGGDGGHNGLKSIISELGTHDFGRMRIGVGKPEHTSMLRDYVLDDFTENEIDILKKTTDFAVKLLDCFIAKGFQSMLNHYSKNKKSYSGSLPIELKSGKGNSESMTTGGK